MKQLANYLLIPGKATLVLYGILSFGFLLVYVWIASFAWPLLFGATTYICMLLAAIVTGLLIALYFDQKKGWLLKRYFILSIVQLLIIWLLATPVRTWQINRSTEAAKSITQSLEIYRLKFGQYPATLNELAQKLEKDIPRRTYLGTRYVYKQSGERDYQLQFASYYGNTAYYNNEKSAWLITD